MVSPIRNGFNNLYDLDKVVIQNPANNNIDNLEEPREDEFVVVDAQPGAQQAAEAEPNIIIAQQNPITCGDNADDLQDDPVPGDNRENIEREPQANRQDANRAAPDRNDNDSDEEEIPLDDYLNALLAMENKILSDENKKLKKEIILAQILHGYKISKAVVISGLTVAASVNFASGNIAAGAASAAGAVSAATSL
jgi:hypothetical protein